MGACLAALFYIRLISLTAGTIVYLFLLALILGHRRPRKFERLLFFLVLSLFLVYAGGLLAMNSELQYTSPPATTLFFYAVLIALGVLFLVPLTVQTHLEYLRQVRGALVSRSVNSLTLSLYVVLIALIALAGITGEHPKLGILECLAFFGQQAGTVAVIAAAVAAVLQMRIFRSAQDPTERGVFGRLSAASVLVVCSPLLEPMARILDVTTWGRGVVITIAGVLPGAVLIRYSLRRNFLEFGAQRNLVYALSATFLALLYLALVHRVSGWLAPVFPPEATASVLLFILIFLFEPIERVIGPVLHRRLSERMDHVQRLTLQIQQEARQGSVAELVALAERRIREEFGLAAVRISVPRNAAAQPLEIPGGLGHAVRLPLMKDKQEIGLLEAVTTGAYITGETSAALEFLAEQLPAMFDLCRLIEEKLRLERELAERERLALLGQMAASVSHNLRNPLSSMKTILQVQLEKPDLPFDIRHDCALVVGEIDRMSTKLTQLLKFAKPSVNGQRIGAVALAKQTAALFGRDAERRNVRLEFDCPAQEVWLLASEEALSEVLSNLIINAIEAQPNGGRVRVGLTQTPENLEIRVDDDGPGISQEARAKIFQPFFTTKATGTGLGLSIVARRVAEMGGEVICESPVRNGRGTRFVMRLPVEPDRKTLGTTDERR